MVFPASVDNNATLEAMKTAWKRYGVLLDPHTAVAFAAADDFVKSGKFPFGHIVILATGHPARAANLVKTATGQAVPLPEKLSLLKRETAPIAVIEPRLGALEGVIASSV